MVECISKWRFSDHKLWRPPWEGRSGPAGRVCAKALLLRMRKGVKPRGRVSGEAYEPTLGGVGRGRQGPAQGRQRGLRGLLSSSGFASGDVIC